MYRIGEFSKLTNLSIRTLRFYNDLGILIPEEVDLYSNYRYYGKKNLEQVRMIENLKEAGFTLEEIKSNWGNITSEKLNEKKLELYNKIYSIEEQIKKIDHLCENENKNKVKCKKL